MKYIIWTGTLCFIMGCGGAATSSVSGKVTFADGAPLGKGVVTYTGETGTFSGSIQSDGSYSMDQVANGSYGVVITGAQEGESAPPEMKYDEKGNYVEPEPQKVTPLIHSKYTNPQQSGLTMKVPGDYNITVEKPE